MDEREFQQRADEALSDMYKALGNAADDYGFEPDFTAGALSIEFDDPPGRFVLSPNSPVRQIWVSAHATSFKLDWDPARSAFVHPGTGQTLKELVEDAIGKQLGEEIKLA
jgi:CyaY protein